MTVIPFVRKARIPEIKIRNLKLEEVLNMRELNKYFELSNMAVYEDSSHKYWTIIKEEKDSKLMLVFDRYNSLEEITEYIEGSDSDS